MYEKGGFFLVEEVVVGYREARIAGNLSGANLLDLRRGS